MTEKIKEAKEKNDISIVEDMVWKDFESLKILNEEEYEDIKKKVDAGAFSGDKYKISELLKTEQRRVIATLPNVDGLYGGKPCVRQYKDKKIMTTRADTDKKFDKSKHYNKQVYENVKSVHECDLQLCNVVLNTQQENAGDNGPCEIFQWAAWGEWGKCDLSCGDKGKLKRKRVCVNTCYDGDKAKSADDKCKPFENNLLNKTFTNEDTTECSPCPEEEQSSWSEWGEWQRKGFQCGSGKAEQERKRKCLPGKSGQKDCPGKDKQTQIFDQPSCEGDVGLEGGKGPTPYNGGESASMDEGEEKNSENNNDEDNKSSGDGGSEAGYNEDDKGNEENNDNQEDDKKDGDDDNTDNGEDKGDEKNEGDNTEGDENEGEDNNEGEVNEEGNNKENEGGSNNKNDNEENDEGNNKDGEENEGGSDNENDNTDNEGGDEEPKEGYNEGDDGDGNNNDGEDKKKNEGGSDNENDNTDNE